MTTNPCEECRPKDVVVVETLGSGHYGDTYHVRDEDGKDYAIKMFRAEKETVERDLKEVFQTGHENCITFISGSWRAHKNESYGHVIISMELCEKKTLKNWMMDNITPEQRPIEKMKRWMAQLLSGLSSLHDWGLVHRDLKPDNIFFARQTYGIEGILKIGDFGMIKRCLFEEDTRIGSVANEKGKAKVTQPVKRYGNIRYAAPEILKDIRKQKALKNEDNSYDDRVDVFSLGVVFAELINPKKQDKDDSKKEQPRKSSELLKGFVGDVKEFLNKAICDSENRLSAAELLKHKFLEYVEKPKCNPPAPAFICKWEPCPKKTIYNGTIARMGPLLKTCVHENPLNYYMRTLKKEKKIHAILGAQRLLTGSSDEEAVFDSENITVNVLSAYFQQLMACGEQLQERLLWLGLETQCLENLKKSYTSGHIKLIPSFKVWCLEEGQQFLLDMWEKVSQERPMFPHGSPLTFVPREDELKYNATVDFSESKEKLQKEWKNLFENESQLSRSKTFKQMLINTPLREDTEHLQELVMLLLSLIDDEENHLNPIDDVENPSEENIRAYIRLLMGACVFRLSINEENADGLNFTLTDVFKEVARTTEYSSFHFPTFWLFNTEPMEHWESWAEIGWPVWYEEEYAWYAYGNRDTSEQTSKSQVEEPDNDSNSRWDLFGDSFDTSNVKHVIKLP